MRVPAIALGLGSVLTAACGGSGGQAPECPGSAPIADDPVETMRGCPGDPGCPDEGDDVLWAGAAAVTITPSIVERMTVDDDGDHLFDEDVDEFDDVDGDGELDAVWIAGLDSPRPAEGIARDTWARAFAVRQNETTIAFVALDLIGWFQGEVVRMRERLPEELGVDLLVVSATHCHQCPDVIGLWGPDEITSGVDRGYVDLVGERAVEAVIAAVEALQPAHVLYGSVRTADEALGGTTNVVGDSRDPVVIDDTLRVLQLRSADDGETIATLVNWGAHPEYAGDGHGLISPDFPAWLCDGVEGGIDLGTVHRAGFGGVCVFVNGAIGGQIGPNGVSLVGLDGVDREEESLEGAEAAGWIAAEYVHRAVEGGEIEETADLSFVTAETYAPILNHAFQTAYLIGVFDREAYHYDPSEPLEDGNVPELLTELAVVRIGRATAVTIPGELFPELAVGGYDGSWTPAGAVLEDLAAENPPDLTRAPCGPYLLEEMDGDYKLLLGLTQDFLGYIVPAYDFEVHGQLPYFERPPGDHYEETNSLGPHAAPLLVGTLQTLLKVDPRRLAR